MKKVLKIVVIALVLGFIVLQFFPPDRTNPPISDAETLEASTQVPADVVAILSRSCNDCHTHKTSYPWYSNISPVSLFLASHIKDGRRHLNFSVWNTYDKKKKAKKLEEIQEQVESGAMPLGSYLWIHRGAVLSESEVSALADWTIKARADLEAAPK
jgi:hypothetical protein